MELRAYQKAAVTQLMAAANLGKRPIWRSATGTGKTVVFTRIVAEFVKDITKQRVLIVGHMGSIVRQSLSKLQNQMPNLPNFTTIKDRHDRTRFVPSMGIVQAAQKAWTARIVVATFQTLRNYLDQVLESAPFDLVVVDEAHHTAPGNTYSDVIDRIIKDNPQVKILGFTATPSRKDGKALGAIFTEIVDGMLTPAAIREGYLTPPVIIAEATNISTAKIKNSKPDEYGETDYNQEKLISVLQTSNWVELATKAYLKHFGLHINLDVDMPVPAKRRVLAFFPRIDMSMVFVDSLIKAGLNAVHIDGSTPDDKTQEYFSLLERGEIDCISNCNVVGEATDIPSIDAIFWAKPSRNANVVTQGIGRGLRLFPGKQECIVVILTVEDPDLFAPATLLGRKHTCRNCGAEYFFGIKNCPICGTPAKNPLSSDEDDEGLEDELEQGSPFLSGNTHKGDALYSRVIDFMNTSRNSWYSSPDGIMSLGLGKEEDQEDHHTGRIVKGKSFGSLFIVPPAHQGSLDKIRARLDAGYAYVVAQAEQPDFTQAKQQNLSNMLDKLKRMLTRETEYTLYWVDGSGKVTMLGSDSESSGLLQSAEDFTSKTVPSKIHKGLVAKNAAWRKSDRMSPAQLQLYRRLGLESIQNPDQVSKGRASEMINHAMALPYLTKFIQEDTLPEPTAKPIEVQALTLAALEMSED